MISVVSSDAPLGQLRVQAVPERRDVRVDPGHPVEGCEAGHHATLPFAALAASIDACSAAMMSSGITGTAGLAGAGDALRLGLHERTHGGRRVVGEDRRVDADRVDQRLGQRQLLRR